MTSKVVEYRLPCPSCTSSDAYHIYDDGHGYCFSCQYYTKGGYENYVDNYTYEYLPWRGITRETFEFYDCLTKIDPHGEPYSIQFKYPNATSKVRLIKEKDFYSQGDIGKAGLFGCDKFSAGGHRYVTITEGELDALSYYQVLKGPVVSVQSSTTAARDCGVQHSWLNSFERIYICFDNDETGREALRSVAKLFDYNKVFVVKLTKRKDANEYLQAGEADELKRIWWNAKKYLPETIISSLDEFKQILVAPRKKGIPYPFPTLTDMTYGIRTSEAVLITAQEKVGKTAFMHAIEHHLLKETDDAIGAIFLEEDKQRHLQAIAGLELQKPVHLPDCDCTEDQIYEALRQVIKVDDRLHIYSHFGSDDPEVLLDIIRFLVSARNCRYILLDHISLACSGSGGENERLALDYLSNRLEMMVKELDFALIVVSHVNDEGKTRGSRNMTKVFDITISATRDTMALDPEERRTMRLSIPLNRFCSRTGPAGDLLFNPDTYVLTEKAANDNNPMEMVA